MPKIIEDKETIVACVPSHYQFVVDSQDVEAIKEHLGVETYTFASFFVVIEDGDYVSVYGCYRTVPELDAPVFRIV